MHKVVMPEERNGFHEEDVSRDERSKKGQASGISGKNATKSL